MVKLTTTSETVFDRNLYANKELLTGRVAEHVGNCLTRQICGHAV